MKTCSENFVSGYACRAAHPVKSQFRRGTLLDAFAIGRDTRVVSLVGAGGKTSLMFALAQEILNLELTVITTTTTRILPPTTEQSPALALLEDAGGLECAVESLARLGQATVGRCITPDGKVAGIAAETTHHLIKLADHVIVEADGASGRPVKAPEEWEPVIPDCADLVIPVVGLDCIGRAADRQTVFRLERFLAATGLSAGDQITPEAIGRLIGSPHGCLRQVPARSRVAAFLNKADRLTPPWDITRIAKTVLDASGPGVTRVAAGRLLGLIHATVFER
jgi:probable selenium-dependent hydroxylase accessory protein YqeC